MRAARDAVAAIRSLADAVPRRLQRGEHLADEALAIGRDRFGGGALRRGALDQLAHVDALARQRVLVSVVIQ